MDDAKNEPSKKEPDRNRVELAFYVIGVIVVPVGLVLMSKLSTTGQIVLGTAILIVVIVMGILYFRRPVMELSSKIDQLTATRKNPDWARFYLGEVENIALRTVSLNILLEHLASQCPEEGRRKVLYEAGAKWGQDWARDLLNIRNQTKLGSRDLDAELLLWSEYDSQVGLGVFSFKINAQGRGVVDIGHPFFSRFLHQMPIDVLVAGYIAGGLEILTGRVLVVNSVGSSNDIQRTASFEVNPGSAVRSEV